MRLAIIGNCQVRSYGLLCRQMLDLAGLRVLDLSLPAHRESAFQSAFVADLGAADLILLQPNKFQQVEPHVLREAHCERVVIVPNFYFRGLSPEACYVGSLGRRVGGPSDYHSVIILEAFRQGLSEREALDRYTPETFLRLGLFDAWQSSLEEMERRDHEVALPVAALIERCARVAACFFTVNHPQVFLVKLYLMELFTHLGLRWREFESREIVDPLGELDTLPLPDEVADFLHLPYRTTQRWFMPSQRQRFLDRAEVIAAYYASYRDAEPDSLRINSPVDMVRFLRMKSEYMDLVDPQANSW